MAIFSYTTGSDSHRISLYANETISDYSSVLLSDLTFVGDPEFKLSSYSEELEEQRAYSYNESALVNFESEDYGLINEIFSYSDDFGLITDQITSEKQKFDYGTITILSSNIPFGKLSISTEFADVSLVRRSVGGITFLIQGKGKIYVLPIHVGSGRIRGLGESQNSRVAYQSGSGKLFGFSGAVYATTNAPSEGIKRSINFSGGAFHAFSRGNYSSTGTFSAFTGAGLSRVIITKAETNIFRFSGSGVEKNTENYVGSGNLFGFVGHVERVTYDYNESSVVRPEGIDYGFIANAYSDDDDYGLISEIVSPQKPWNNINYGFIIDNDTRIPFGKLKLDSLTSVTQSPSIFGTDGISITGSARLFVLPIHKGSGQFVLGGSAEPKAALSQIGSGSLFAFTGSAESIGAKQESTNLFRFSSSTNEAIAPAPHVGSGRIFAFTGSAESKVSKPSTTGLFKFTGSAIDKYIQSYVASGNLFGFVGHAEKVTYDYNESSIVTIDGLDYGFVSENHTSDDDYGYITQPTNYGNQKANYGYITDNVNRFPYGVLRFSTTDTARIQASLSHVGNGFVRVVSGPPSEIRAFGYAGDGTINITRRSTSKIRFSLTHIGSGSLFAFTGGAEAIVPTIPPGSGLFKFTGSAVERNTESYFGSGSLFAFTGATEVSSNAPSTTGLFKFFGSVFESAVPAPHIGSGSLFTFISSTESTSNVEEKTTLFKFTGSAVEKNTESYFGSGSLFAFTGSTFTAAAKENPQGLFKFFGSAVEKNTESYVGSGSLFTFVSSTESSSISSVTSGLFKFTGSAVEKNTESYVGSGTLFTFDSSTSVFAGNLSVEGALFKFSGAASIGFTLTEIGTGSFNLRQKVSGLDSRDKQRYISGIERTTSIPEIKGALFRATGVVTLFFQYTETGSGFITLAGNARTQTKPVHVGQGTLNIFGSAETPRTRPYTGSGSLFGLNSSTTVAISRPPVRGALFTFTGSAVEKNTESYVGSTEAKLSGTANIIARLKHIGSGKTTIFGSAVEKNTESYVGSGRIFGFTGAAEAVGRKLPEFKTLFKITGSGSVANSYGYTGSGSLFAIVSKTESTSSVERKTSLFKFSGSASERNTESYVGSGIVRFRTKDSILDINGKVIFISATESTTVVPPTRSQLFKFGGLAKTERNTNWTTTGTLFGFGGGAERVSFTPAKSTVLFEFVGNSEERKTKSYTGSGTIFAIIGTSESSAVVSSAGGLFKITGSAKESVLPATYVGSGSLFAIVSKTESVTFSPPTTNLFKFTGSAVEKNTESYVGSGRIFGFQSAGIARVVPYDRTQILFRLLGTLRESFNKSGYIGNTQVEFIGNSSDKYVEYDSPKPTRIYII
jgi:hypothetical protein